MTWVEGAGAIDSMNENRTDGSREAVLRSAHSVGPFRCLCIGHVAPSPWAHSHSSAVAAQEPSTGLAMANDWQSSQTPAKRRSLLRVIDRFIFPPAALEVNRDPVSSVVRARTDQEPGTQYEGPNSRLPTRDHDVGGRRARLHQPCAARASI